MNRLASETSPYLLQHRHNPVDWWPWGEKAFAEAKRTGKPMLLSIGYAACHWCHVMAHESFEDEATARVMNELFVNIKVDREERPDVDYLYMSALQMLGQPGGWPLTMFLTPDGAPFWGGTYFPKESQFGRPAFVTVLREVARLFNDEPHRIENNRSVLLSRLSQSTEAEPDASLGRPWLDAVARHALQAFDSVNGGLHGAPKFPNVPLIELIWRYGQRAGNAEAEAHCYFALERMARGGIHDHIGGGFARYAVDERWLVPHFEKMLYDNALLLELYALAAVRTGQPIFSDAAAGIATWLAREMVTPEGAFAASLDADSEGEEGRYYVWTDAEIRQVLGSDAELFATFYGVTAEGNWEGHTILNRLEAEDPDEETAARLASLKTKLLAHRETRVRPGLDDKVLADWNGLMIAALARAARLLDRPGWLDLAVRAFRFVTHSMMRDGVVGHAWREGRLLFPGFAADQASLMRAALALHEATREEEYRACAQGLAEVLAREFADDAGVLFMVSRESGELLVRPQPTADDAVPNANGLYAEGLVRLAALSGTAADRLKTDRILAVLAGRCREAPLAHASILNALDLRLSGATIVVAGVEREGLLAAAEALPYPLRTIAEVVPGRPLPPDHPAAAQLHAAGAGAAFVCAGERCSLPITDPSELARAVALAVRMSAPA